MESIVLIHNVCTELVGSNQIKTVFDPEYERYVNLEGYDRISQYYLHPDDCESEDDGSVEKIIFSGINLLFYVANDLILKHCS